MYSSYGLETGLNYQLINEFAKDNHCEVKIIAAGRNDNYIDSLRQGRVDLVVTRKTDSIGSSDSISILSDLNGSSV